MGGLILVLFYGSIVFCVVASVIKIDRYASAPLHLHWEIYQGSSVYESVDWWNHPPVPFMEKLKGVAADLFFLKGYFRRDRELWLFLYLFHLGIYLLILWHIWLFAGAVLLDIHQSLCLWKGMGSLCHSPCLCGRGRDFHQKNHPGGSQILHFSDPLHQMGLHPDHPAGRVLRGRLLF